MYELEEGTSDTQIPRHSSKTYCYQLVNTQPNLGDIGHISCSQLNSTAE